LVLLALQETPLEASVLLFLALDTPSAALFRALDGFTRSASHALCERLRELLLRLGGGLTSSEEGLAMLR
jgi:hypothetical protein